MSSKWERREAAPTVTALGLLIARMALDEELHRRYLEQPERVIADAGLSAAEEQALLNGDWGSILRLLGSDSGSAARTLPKERPSGGGG